MKIISDIENSLRSAAETVPIEWFTCLGAFIEEVIAPIPSPLIMATAGSIAEAQGKGVTFLLWLSVLGAVGKVAGAWLIYAAASKLEDVFIRRFGKFLGVSEADVENLSRHLNKGFKDDIILFLLRAAPIVPSSPVSAVCGLVKLNIRTYLAATFFGTLIRNGIYLYIGYAGVAAYESLLKGMENTEALFQIGILAALVAAVGFIYWKRGKGDLVGWIRRKLGARGKGPGSRD